MVFEYISNSKRGLHDFCCILVEKRYFTLNKNRMNIQNSESTNIKLPEEFLFVKKILSEIGNMKIGQVAAESESSEYGACTFELNNLNIRFRTAKITPTKTGQFVTLWKRIGKGPIQPFDSTDPIDFFLVSVRKDTRFGLFVFPKTILVAKEIVSDKKEGKRAIRVYPPWDTTASKQAQKTQKWQLGYFLEIQNDEKMDANHVKSFFSAEGQKNLLSPKETFLHKKF